VDDTYTFSGNLHDYYNDTFGLNGGNNQGGLGDGSTNPVTKTDGYTYIDYVGGSCPNAYFDGYSINFCKGYEVLDVLGHEYTHGVGWFAIPPQGLTYSYESGALSEGYSDIFGEAAEYYTDGSNDWLLGEDLPGGATRSMSNPASLEYPDRFYSPYFYCGSSDNGGVHLNATLLGHAAYLAAMGGTFNGCTITGIGRAREEAIFYRAYTTYSVASTDFNDTYTYLNTSCADLYGSTSTYCINLKKALQSVELNQAGRCSGVARVAPACNTPKVTSVTSSTANGYYKAGKTISITLNFSVYTTGSGTVRFNSGGSCSISVSNKKSASCVYTVRSGQNSADLNVSSVTGSFANQYGNTVSSLAITTNLATSKNIIIDTIMPYGRISINSGAAYTSSSKVTLSLYASDARGVTHMRFSNNKITWSTWQTLAWTKTWSLINTRGVKTVYVQYKDRAGNITTKSDTITYYKPESIVTAPGAGISPQIKAFSYKGVQRSLPNNLFAYDKGYLEGVHTATCDVDGDKIDEIVVSVGPKQSPWVKVFRQNNQAISRFMAYAPNIQGGVFVACGDLNGDGKAEIVTGVPEGYGPHIRTFNGQTGQTIISSGFFAYATHIRTGIRVATGDVDGDGRDEIISSTGKGAAPHIRIFEGNGAVHSIYRGFYAYNYAERNGINVATGDVNGDGKDEIITGSNAGRNGEVQVFTPAGKLLRRIYAFGSQISVKVSAGDINADGKDEIIASTDAGNNSEIKVLGFNGAKLSYFSPYGGGFRGWIETATAYLEK
jgi:hypothetical protein